MFITSMIRDVCFLTSVRPILSNFVLSKISPLKLLQRGGGTQIINESVHVVMVGQEDEHNPVQSKHKQNPAFYSTVT